MGEVVHHLVNAERHPKTDTGCVAKAPEVSGASFDTIHREMHEEVNQSQPPQFQINQADDRKRDHRMNCRVQRKGGNEAPIGSRFLQHVAILQWKVGDKMFDLKRDNQKYYESARLNGVSRCC